MIRSQMCVWIQMIMNCMICLHLTGYYAFLIFNQNKQFLRERNENRLQIFIRTHHILYWMFIFIKSQGQQLVLTKVKPILKTFQKSYSLYQCSVLPCALQHLRFTVNYVCAEFDSRSLFTHSFVEVRKCLCTHQYVPTSVPI